MKSGLYCITNMVTGERYIGQTKNVNKRIIQQKSNLICGRGNNRHLQASYDKYGLAAFSFEVLFYCPVNELEFWEKFYIALYQSDCREFGYNIESGGFTKKPMASETKLLIGAVHKGKKLPSHVVDLLKQNNACEGNPRCRKVIDTATGKIYEYAKLIAIEFGINYGTLISKLSGRDKNDTTFKYVSNDSKMKHKAPVHDIVTGQKWDDYSTAAAELGFNPGTLRKWLGGQRPNNTNIRYVK